MSVDDIKAQWSTVTPGPWKWGRCKPDDHRWGVFAKAPTYKEEQYALGNMRLNRKVGATPEDLEALANSRNHIDELLDKLAEANKRIAALEAEVPWLDKPDGPGTWWAWHDHMDEPVRVDIYEAADGRLIIRANWFRGRDSEVSLYPSWQWQRDIAPPAPRSC